MWLNGPSATTASWLSGSSAASGVMAEPPDAAVAAVAVTQFGNVTRSQLLALGVSSRGITRRIEAGRLYRVFRGVYAVGRPPNLPLEWASAALFACGTGAALSHSSAMWAWGFWERWARPVEVTITHGDKRPQGVRVHRSRTLTPADTRIQLGVRVTSPARTIRDMAPRFDDDELARTVNSALHSKFLRPHQLTEQLLRRPDRRVAYHLTTEGGPTRSDWERAFPAFCRQYGLPIPVFNARVAGHEADLVWHDAKLIAELDSWQFHSTRVDFERDRDRDADTLESGYATVRITWERMLARPAREADRLHRIRANRLRAAA